MNALLHLTAQMPLPPPAHRPPGHVILVYAARHYVHPPPFLLQGGCTTLTMPTSRRDSGTAESLAQWSRDVASTRDSQALFGVQSPDDARRVAELIMSSRKAKAAPTTGTEASAKLTAEQILLEVRHCPALHDHHLHISHTHTHTAPNPRRGRQKGQNHHQPSLRRLQLRPRSPRHPCPLASARRHRPRLPCTPLAAAAAAAAPSLAPPPRPHGARRRLPAGTRAAAARGCRGLEARCDARRRRSGGGGGVVLAGGRVAEGVGHRGGAGG